MIKDLSPNALFEDPFLLLLSVMAMPVLAAAAACIPLFQCDSTLSRRFPATGLPPRTPWQRTACA